MQVKARTAALTFMLDVQLSDLGRKPELRPQGVGYIDLRDTRVTGGFSMAIDALHPVMQMLLAGPRQISHSLNGRQIHCLHGEHQIEY